MSGMHNRNTEFSIIVIFFLSLTLSTCSRSYVEGSPFLGNDEPHAANASGQNQAFRDKVVHFVRAIVEGATDVPCSKDLATKGGWNVGIDVWYGGEKIGTGIAHHRALHSALQNAAILAISKSGLSATRLKEARLVIRFPDRKYAIMEYKGGGLELVGDLVAVRRIDKRLLREKILQAKEYLLRVIDEESHGVHKYYYAETDTFEPKVYTIYTSSLVFTLLKIYKIDADPQVLKQISRCADYILSMQSEDLRAPRSYGAFHYSYDIETKTPDRLYVAGTTSKTIFTLLELHRFTGDPRYLESAKLAAQWLLTMQRPDGTVTSSLRQDKNGRSHFSREFSFLYTGQVLSALSRMYLATGESRYVQAAGKIAWNIKARLPANGGYVGDDYRKPNPVSSSWAVMSLLDFYRASGDAHFGDILFTYSKALMRRQIQKADDIGSYGRWEGSTTSSGNGWLNEVMSELYLCCRHRGIKNCDKYKDTMVKAGRWIIQHVCSEENLYQVKNPGTARGGIFWSAKDRYVRTDSVCHCVNAFINMLNQLEEPVLINVPEKPVKDILGFR
jgi:hypothetical protein